MEYSEDLLRSYRTIQNSGITNMLDAKTVQYYAFQVDMYELVSMIQHDKQDYLQIFKDREIDWEAVEPYDDKLDKLRELKEEERSNY
jgi:hypothetical protein